MEVPCILSAQDRNPAGQCWQCTASFTRIAATKQLPELAVLAVLTAATPPSPPHAKAAATRQPASQPDCAAPLCSHACRPALAVPAVPYKACAPQPGSVGAARPGGTDWGAGAHIWHRLLQRPLPREPVPGGVHDGAPGAHTELPHGIAIQGAGEQCSEVCGSREQPRVPVWSQAWTHRLPHAVAHSMCRILEDITTTSYPVPACH